jgi:hypothetical protein
MGPTLHRATYELFHKFTDLNSNLMKFDIWGHCITLIMCFDFLPCWPITKTTLHNPIKEFAHVDCPINWQSLFAIRYCALLFCWIKNFRRFLWYILRFAEMPFVNWPQAKLNKLQGTPLGILWTMLYSALFLVLFSYVYCFRSFGKMLWLLLIIFLLVLKLVHFVTYTIMSRVGVTHNMSFGMVDWIYCTLYIHTTRDYSYSYSTHFTVHRCTRIRILSLH